MHASACRNAVAVVNCTYELHLLFLGTCTHAGNGQAIESTLLLEPFVEGEFTKWIKNTGESLKVGAQLHTYATSMHLASKILIYNS